jgi:hypothetical protein
LLSTAHNTLFLDRYEETGYHPTMTAYATPSIPSSSDAVRAAREKRKQVLDAVSVRRRAIYKRFMEKKRCLQASSDMI